MIWLRPEQLKEIGVSKGILHRNRSVWKHRPTGERGRNGKLIDEFLLESLPERFQAEWVRRTRGEESPKAHVPSPKSEEGSLTTDAQLPPIPSSQSGDAEGRLTEALVRYRPETRDRFLAEAQRLSSIVERYEAITPKRMRSAEGHEFVPEVLALCEEARCTDPVILAIEPSRGKRRSPYTLDEWVKRYRVEGLAVFLRKPATPTGTIDKRKAVISAEAAEWVNRKWRTYPSSRRLYKDLVKLARKNKWQIPAEGYFWRLYQKLPNVVSTLAFEGVKAYTGKHSPYVPRDYRDLAALQILCGDHSVRDVTVMLPDGTLTRPWLTLWQDLRTGLIWGWHLDVSPSSNTIGLAYVNGVQNFGAQPLANPDAGFYSYLYTDQGKDYKAKTLTGQTLEFKKAARIEGGLNVLCTQRRVGFMDELGIKHLMARGYNAREKFVERTHKDISHWEQNTFENEYCGRGIGHKPERWKAAWQRHEKLLKKIGTKNLEWLVSESPFMTLEDYRESIAGWITEFNYTEHTRAVLGGATIVPIQEYERLYTTRYEISDDALALLLMRADRRTIGKNGVQFFQSNWHFLHEAMGEFKGQEIEIRYTDGDWERIWAVLPNGNVVEAAAVGNSGVLNRNKKTMGIVAKQRAHEMKVFREFRFIQESNYHGESVEDRVAAQLAGPDDVLPPEQERMVVNARPIVHAMNRFEGSKLAARSGVTAEQVEKANVIEGMFGEDRAETRIKDEWE